MILVSIFFLLLFYYYFFFILILIGFLFLSWTHKIKLELIFFFFFLKLDPCLNSNPNRTSTPNRFKPQSIWNTQPRFKPWSRIVQIPKSSQINEGKLTKSCNKLDSKQKSRNVRMSRNQSKKKKERISISNLAKHKMWEKSRESMRGQKKYPISADKWKENH